MIKLKDILLEKFASKAQQRYMFATDKEAAKKLASKMTKKDYEELPDKVKEDYDLDNHPKHYKAVYSAEGMQLSAFSASELKAGYEVVMLIDVDKDPMPDAFIFTRGNRIKLLATDGGSLSKSLVVKKVVKMVKTAYNLEASKKMDDIMKGKGAPPILDKKRIEKMVGPKFIKHLDNGYYERKLKKGGNVVKRMYGK